MSWHEVDWTQERPSNAAAEWLWRAVEVRPIDEVPPPVQEYIAELRRINVNGGAAYARFYVEGNRDYDWFATRNRWDEISFFSRFLAHPVVSNVLPDVTKGASFDDSIAFEWGSSLVLDGELARALVNGGAYKKFEGTPRDAKRLGMRVCDALFGDRFLDVEIYRCWKAWSPWFYDVAWDSTCVLIDRRLQAVSLFVSTDTD
ncbi:MAG: hypothetical protein R3268_06325 [Acidiferrobacterales bacterium]|nr:hypothetical protein [Acidiferrobacterales bacterium]